MIQAVPKIGNCKDFFTEHIRKTVDEAMKSICIITPFKITIKGPFLISGESTFDVINNSNSVELKSPTLILSEKERCNNDTKALDILLNTIKLESLHEAADAVVKHLSDQGYVSSWSKYIVSDTIKSLYFYILK